MDTPITQQASLPPLLEMRRISVMRGERVVLHELDLNIRVGEHIAILGPNGCGKSTLIKTITRDLYPLLRPESSMAIMGQEKWKVEQLRSVMGIVSNDLMATCTRDFTGAEIVLSGFFGSIGLWPYHHVTDTMRQKARQVLERLDALHLANRWMDELSSGEARRILIARALVHSPTTLLLDEPGASLDVFAQRELARILRELAQSGIAIILVTHHLADIIPEIERVVLMREGRLVADGPKEEILNAETLQELFGVPISISQRDGFYLAW